MKLGWATARATKRALILAALGSMCLLLAWGMWPGAVPVDVAELQKGPLLVTVDEEGKTRIKEVYNVSAPITGKLVRLTLDAGDNVQKDVTTVAIMEPMAPPFLDVRATRELEAQIKSAKAFIDLAEAEVRQATAELEFAESDLARAEALVRSKIIAQRTLERARMDVDTRRALLTRAKSNLEVRKRELETAQARLIGPGEASNGETPTGCCVSVLAPVSGRVLRLIQESERVVSAGTPLVEVGDPGDIELVVELLSADAVRVHEGAMASVEAWGGASLAAKVSRVEPSGFTKVSALGIEEQRVRTILQLQKTGSASERLGHEFRVVVKITVYEADDALRLPISALFRKRDQWCAYTVDHGRARTVPLEIGQRNTEYAEVLAGLRQGAVVILHPSDRVAEGVRVTPY